MSRLRRLTLSPLERRAMYRVLDSFERFAFFHQADIATLLLGNYPITDPTDAENRLFVKASPGVYYDALRMSYGEARVILNRREHWIERYGYAPMGALRSPSGATWLRYGWQTLGRSNDGSGR